MNIAKSLRPKMVVIPWLIYSCVIIKNTGLNLVCILLGLLLFIAIYGIVAVFNDISDYRTDVINKRDDIPYANNSVSKQTLQNVAIVLGVIIIVVCLMLNLSVFLWVGMYLLLGWLYSGPANIKSRGFFAAILLGVCYGVIPWLIGASSIGTRITSSLLIVAAAYFIFSSGSTVIKDFRDVKGDKETGKNTILVVKGALYTRRYYITLTSIAYIILISACLSNGNIWPVIISPLFLYSNYLLLRDKSIFTNAKIRSKNSGRSRMLFFGYAALVYVLI